MSKNKTPQATNSGMFSVVSAIFLSILCVSILVQEFHNSHGEGPFMNKAVGWGGNMGRVTAGQSGFKDSSLPPEPDLLRTNNQNRLTMYSHLCLSFCF